MYLDRSFEYKDIEDITIDRVKYRDVYKYRHHNIISFNNSLATCKETREGNKQPQVGWYLKAGAFLVDLTAAIETPLVLLQIQVITSHIFYD